jgi:hypothetical protein
MPGVRKLPPFLHRETSRHGRAVWYFRRGKGARVRLPGDFGSVEFWSAYEAAAKGVDHSAGDLRQDRFRGRWPPISNRRPGAS